MSKTIPLTQGKVAIVDDEDYEELSKYKWCVHKEHEYWYAVCTVNNKKNKGMTKMHRAILGFPEGKQIDHINHNGLDNRKENLRVCTHAENLYNRKKSKNNTSGLKGVSHRMRNRLHKWEASIKHCQKTIYLGCFTDKNDAGRAYDKKARELFGEYAVLNFPEMKQ